MFDLELEVAMTWVAVAVVLIFGMIVCSDYLRSNRRQRLRAQAWKMALGPPADWRPRTGERKTVFRTARSADLVAEILRATAIKYERALGLEVQIRGFEVESLGPNTFEGRMTIEFL